MRYLNAYIGSFLLFWAIVSKDETIRAMLYSASAVNLCVAIIPKDK